MDTSDQPAIEERPERPYAFVGGTVSMDDVGSVADRFPEVFDAVGQSGLTPAGPPFLRYRAIEMDRELEIEACVPIDGSLPSEGPVSMGTLPGGRYGMLAHRGSFDGLQDTNARLLAWADDRGLRWDATPSDGGDVWAGRIEIYESGPATEPDPAKWVTIVAIKLAD